MKVYKFLENIPWISLKSPEFLKMLYQAHTRVLFDLNWSQSDQWITSKYSKSDSSICFSITLAVLWCHKPKVASTSGKWERWGRLTRVGGFSSVIWVWFVGTFWILLFKYIQGHFKFRLQSCFQILHFYFKWKKKKKKVPSLSGIEELFILSVDIELVSLWPWPLL